MKFKKKKLLISFVPSVLSVTITTCFIPLQNCIISAEYLSHHTMSQNCTKCNIYWWLCTFSFALVLGYILQKYLPYDWMNTLTLPLIYGYIFTSTQKGAKVNLDPSIKPIMYNFMGLRYLQNRIVFLKWKYAFLGSSINKEFLFSIWRVWGCLKEVLRVYKGSFKCLSRKIQGCLRVFQDHYRKLSYTI